jgi:hypothetical protein
MEVPKLIMWQVGTIHIRIYYCLRVRLPRSLPLLPVAWVTIRNALQLRTSTASFTRLSARMRQFHLVVRLIALSTF